MEINNNISFVPEPLENCITVYSDDGCYGCIKIIEFLNENNINHSVVDCTNYFPHNITPLALFVNKHIKNFEDYCDKYKNKIVFPMIFNEGQFIGYLPLEEYKIYLKNASNN
jgi:glutaredoxin